MEEKVRGSVSVRAVVAAHELAMAFAAEHRDDVAELAAVSPRFADLAVSFPGLLFALATGYGTAAARRKSSEQILNGKPLREAADSLGLPFWLRRVVPEAFVAPIPVLPKSPEFTKRIANHIPDRRNRHKDWLDKIGRATRLGDDVFAAWLASRRDLLLLIDGENDIGPLALYAYYSNRPTTLAGGLVERRWDPEQQLQSALWGCEMFLTRLAIEVLLSRPLPDSWARPGRAGEFEFKPIATACDLLEEAREMRNCVRRYVFKIALGECRLFSVRRNGERIATLELIPSKRRGLPLVHQMRGRCNGPVPRSVREAALEWRSAHSRPLTECQRAEILPDCELWRRLTQPYETAKEVCLIAVDSPSITELETFVLKQWGIRARMARPLWLRHEAA
ncbi:MAG: hypothetical protein F9K44_09220 [Hyphomicrobiaceae bacterium]|nr:MAG: hypothetical protein F9K44_09220 [Hyphomicrobiaceae bacterium]